MAAIVSTPRHRERLCGSYISSSGEFRKEFLDNLARVTGNSPFWSI